METPISLIPGFMPNELSVPVEKKHVEEVVCNNNCDLDVIAVTTDVENADISVDEYVRNYSLKQLREMCNKQGISNAGNKRDLAERVKNNTAFLSD